jgi:hypothetical protein
MIKKDDGTNRMTHIMPSAENTSTVVAPRTEIERKIPASG